MGEKRVMEEEGRSQGRRKDEGCDGPSTIDGSDCLSSLHIATATATAREVDLHIPLILSIRL